MSEKERRSGAPASLQRRVLAIAAVAFLVVAGLLGFSATIVLDVRNVVDEQRKILLPASQLVADYDVAVREQQRGERGFVITSDESFLAPFERGSVSARASVIALERLLAGDADGLQLLARAEVAHVRWVTEAAEPAVAAVRRGEVGEAAATIAIVSRPRFEAFQAVRMDLEVHVDGRLEASEVALATSEQRLLRLLFGAGLTALLIVVAVLAALNRWVIVPVERLSAAVRQVATGNLGDNVSATGPREVVELAGDVEAMRLRIVAELEEMRRANEALAQQAPLVVGLRDVLLPGITAPAGVALGSLFLPAEGVLAGDWFDVWTLDDGRIGLVMVDISGHGADAGLFALRLKDLLVSAVAIFPQPGAALAWVADRLGDTGERFATIFLAVIDADHGRMQYANAGHPVVFLAGLDSIVSLLPTGPLLGPLRAGWETRTTDLSGDTVLVAYTDGLIEARSDTGEEFGSARLLEVVTRLRGRSPSEVVEGCRRALDAFSAERFQDDVTLVAVAVRAPLLR